MENQQVPQRLMEAAEAGDINLLYGCIQDYPKILDSIDEIPFVDTPLHKAASAGHAHFALEMMRLMPSFGKKLNPQGLSPLDLALRSREGLSPSDLDLPKMAELSPKKLDLRNRITSTISRLINFDKELIRVKGRESFTPLHYVVEKGDIDLLAEFLLACLESIMDRTIRDETALHIAVKSSKLQAFKVLLGCLCRIRKHQHVRGWKDDKGNTLLHIAVSTSQAQVVKSLLQRNFLLQTKSLHNNKINLDKNAKNLEGRTALDIATTIVDPGEAQREIKEALDHAGASKSTSLREDYYSFAKNFMSPQCIIEFFTQQWFYQGRELGMETRNAILVVAVLIATTTFQAILSPPGGVVGRTGDNNNQLTANENHINATIISITTNNNLIPTYNVSYINATIFTNTATTNTSSTMDPSKRVLFKITKFNGPITYGSFLKIFYSLNTTCFLASVMAIIFLLPLQLFSLFLYGPLFLLMLSYGASFAVISPSTSYTIKFLLSSCAFAVWIYFMGPLNIAIGGNLGAVFPLIFVVGHQRKRLQMLLHLLERS
ncbi:Ankyrin repeat-containing protein BDA1 [Camellia lanceoleosa]|uniref:Ankyrin repeat-containing protein BDA1 n=1 Tax=Camellia lanceoleosa TaxID=1840588 RepID=A0ACC0HQU4_9ERIC|nr:Ankyrin repeat-containing protein BDA1 [Camellia lanceoleosa]